VSSNAESTLHLPGWLFWLFFVSGTFVIERLKRSKPSGSRALVSCATLPRGSPAEAALPGAMVKRASSPFVVACCRFVLFPFLKLKVMHVVNSVVSEDRERGQQFTPSPPVFTCDATLTWGRRGLTGGSNHSFAHCLSIALFSGEPFGGVFSICQLGEAYSVLIHSSFPRPHAKNGVDLFDFLDSCLEKCERWKARIEIDQIENEGKRFTGKRENTKKTYRL
jgi:hypothetical protein